MIPKNLSKKDRKKYYWHTLLALFYGLIGIFFIGPSITSYRYFAQHQTAGNIFGSLFLTVIAVLWLFSARSEITILELIERGDKQNSNQDNVLEKDTKEDGNKK